MSDNNPSIDMRLFDEAKIEIIKLLISEPLPKFLRNKEGDSQDNTNIIAFFNNKPNTNENTIQRFLDYLKSQNSAENLQFIIALYSRPENYSKEQHIQNIFHLYIKDDAPYSINISGPIRNNIKEAMNQYSDRKEVTIALKLAQAETDKINAENEKKEEETKKKEQAKIERLLRGLILNAILSPLSEKKQQSLKKNPKNAIEAYMKKHPLYNDNEQQVCTLAQMRLYEIASTLEFKSNPPSLTSFLSEVLKENTPMQLKSIIIGPLKKGLLGPTLPSPMTQTINIINQTLARSGGQINLENYTNMLDVYDKNNFLRLPSQQGDDQRPPENPPVLFSQKTSEPEVMATAKSIDVEWPTRPRRGGPKSSL